MAVLDHLAELPNRIFVRFSVYSNPIAFVPTEFAGGPAR